MEEVEPSHESTVFSPRRPLHRWALFAGFLLAFSEMMLRLLSGKDIVDAIWPHAVRSLEWTLTLRSSPTLTLSIFVLAGCSRTPETPERDSMYGAWEGEGRQWNGGDRAIEGLRAFVNAGCENDDEELRTKRARAADKLQSFCGSEAERQTAVEA